jgi:hypothetical protein
MEKVKKLREDMLSAIEQAKALWGISRCPLIVTLFVWVG